MTRTDVLRMIKRRALAAGLPYTPSPSEAIRTIAALVILPEFFPKKYLRKLFWVLRRFTGGG